jgi:hypothetical protein
LSKWDKKLNNGGQKGNNVMSKQYMRFGVDSLVRTRKNRKVAFLIST